MLIYLHPMKVYTHPTIAASFANKDILFVFDHSVVSTFSKVINALKR